MTNPPEGSHWRGPNRLPPESTLLRPFARFQLVDRLTDEAR